MITKKRIGINMFSGGMGYIIPMLVNLISTPVVINWLGEEAYGLQSISAVVLGYLAVTDMGLDIPITKKVSENLAKRDTHAQDKFLRSTFKIYTLIGIFGATVLWIGIPYLIDILSIPPLLTSEAETVLKLTALGFIASVYMLWGKAIFNGFHRFDITNTIAVCNNTAGIALGLILIYYGYGVVGFIVARVLAYSIAAITYGILTKKHFSFAPFFSIDSTATKFLLSQLSYGVLIRISGMVLSRLDQVIISAWIGIHAVALYAVPLLIANTLSGFIANVTHFAFPMASSLHTDESEQKLYQLFYNVSRFITFTSTFIFIPFIILSENILALWINPQMATQSAFTLQLLLISFYINSCLTIAINAFLMGMGYLKYFTIYSIIRSLTLLLFFLLLIKPFGIIGAAYAYSISVLIDMIYNVRAIRIKLKFTPWHFWKNIYIPYFIVGTISGSIIYFISASWINSWIVNGCIINIYGLLTFILIYAFKLVNKSEILATWNYCISIVTRK
jgi:O-antigen/teichoic acid export membrane protein